MNTEEQMIFAHKEGRGLFASITDLTPAELQSIARRFVTAEERDAFIAGYLGEQKRA